MSEEFTFHAVIQAGDAGGAFVFFPFNMLESIGTIDGVPYSGKVFKYGFPQHLLGVLKSLRTQIGKGLGDTVMITSKRVK